jgi:hypothetical protein
MSISRVREAYDIVNKNNNISWVEEDLLDLIYAIAEFILKSTPETANKNIPAGCVTIDEFVDLYPLFSRTMVLQACHANKGNPGFYQIKRYWYIHPESLLPYFKESMKSYERRMKLMERMRNSVQ